MVALRKEQAQNPAMAIQKKMTPEETREYIHSLRGKFKMMPSDKPFAEWMAEMKKEEIELEERKLQRLADLGKK